jgi:hypothetical protein
MNNTPFVSRRSARRSLVLYAGIAALALAAGCAQMQPMQATAVTNISVAVVPVGAPPAGWVCYRSADVPDYLLCVDKDPIQVPGSMGDNNLLSWSLVSNGWKFDPRLGIDIKPRGQWDLVTAQDRLFQQKAKRDGKVYKYQINVLPNTETPKEKPITWDPSIMN